MPRAARVNVGNHYYHVLNRASARSYCGTFATFVTTLVVFARWSTLAAALLVPYLLWVAFATYLNAMIVVLN